ncbi:MAG: polysaccharide biosynthesis/export family protein, partial [Muribaculaceae bacterium]|nr:polysaccharide biosynthesis/export family protein [Muribaculaceae bacterium]
MQNATPDAVHVIEQAANVTVRPGDEISIVVTSTDDHATAQLNLLIDSRRLAKRGSDIKGSPVTNGSGQNNLMDYVVDTKGDIDFPLLGEIHVAGLTRDQIATTIKREILNKGLLKDDKDLTV